MSEEPLEDFVERMAKKLDALERDRQDVYTLLENRFGGWHDSDVWDELRRNAEWLIRDARERGMP